MKMINTEYYKEFKVKVIAELIKMIKEMKVEMEEDGLIPTVDLLIERLEKDE